MKIATLCLVLANTIRSRAYVQMLFHRELYPSMIMLLPGEEAVKSGMPATIDVPLETWDGAERGSFVFRPYEGVRDTLARHAAEFSVLHNGDINSAEVTGQIKAIAQEYFVYSGYSRVLINADLAGSKRIIHVHGGYLPQYKGATGFYYALLEKGFLGQSAILIDQGVDTGKIISRKKYKIFKNIDVDYVYDPITRADLLAEVLRGLHEKGGFDLTDNEGGVMHYVIHPALKFIAIGRAVART
jgi:methionyl-tRNA formyltransferase